MRNTLIAMLAVAIVAPVSLVGCDRTVETQTRTTVDDGKVKQETKRVTEDPAGNVTVTKEKTEKTTDNR